MRRTRRPRWQVNCYEFTKDCERPYGSPGAHWSAAAAEAGGSRVEEIMPKKASKGQSKIHKVMKEKKEGTLKSSSGKKVTSRKQAVAIALSEARKRRAQKDSRRKS